MEKDTVALDYASTPDEVAAVVRRELTPDDVKREVNVAWAQKYADNVYHKWFVVLMERTANLKRIIAETRSLEHSLLPRMSDDGVHDATKVAVLWRFGLGELQAELEKNALSLERVARLMKRDPSERLLKEYAVPRPLLLDIVAHNNLDHFQDTLNMLNKSAHFAALPDTHKWIIRRFHAHRWATHERPVQEMDPISYREVKKQFQSFVTRLDNERRSDHAPACGGALPAEARQ